MEDTHTEDDKEAMVFIHTLKSGSAFGAGSYAMSALKRMSPTEDFLKLSPTARRCANEDQQHCLMKKYLDQKLQECGCIPWEFPKDSNSTKVTYWERTSSFRNSILCLFRNLCRFVSKKAETVIRGLITLTTPVRWIVKVFMQMLTL